MVSLVKVVVIVVKVARSVMAVDGSYIAVGPGSVVSVLFAERGGCVGTTEASGARVGVERDWSVLPRFNYLASDFVWYMQII